jgi:hypothetical protein
MEVLPLLGRFGPSPWYPRLDKRRRAHNWAKLPISSEQFARGSAEQMRLHFPNCQLLPSAENLLSNLNRARSASSSDSIELRRLYTQKCSASGSPVLKSYSSPLRVLQKCCYSISFDRWTGYHYKLIRRDHTI